MKWPWAGRSGLAKFAIIFAVGLCAGIGLCGIAPIAGMPDNDTGLFIMFASIAGAITIPVCTLGLIVVLLLASFNAIRDRYYR